MHAADTAAYSRLAPLVAGWAAGKGTSAELKRYGRRQELRLLMLSPTELKSASECRKTRPARF